MWNPGLAPELEKPNTENRLVESLCEKQMATAPPLLSQETEILVLDIESGTPSTEDGMEHGAKLKIGALGKVINSDWWNSSPLGFQNIFRQVLPCKRLKGLSLTNIVPEKKPRDTAYFEGSSKNGRFFLPDYTNVKCTS